MPLILFAFLKDFRMDMTISCTAEFQAQSNLAKLHYYILEKTILFCYKSWLIMEMALKS